MNKLLKSATLLCGFAVMTIAQNAKANTQAAPELKNPAYATFNDTYYQQGKLIDKYMGDIIAVQGKVIDEKPGPQEKPIFQIELSGKVQRTIWVASLVKMLPNTVKKGETINVLGYFDETAKETTYMAQLAKTPEYVLGFCFQVENSGLPIYFSEWMSRCVDWENGKQFDEKSIMDKE
jgi:hypothetical protein